MAYETPFILRCICLGFASNKTFLQGFSVLTYKIYEYPLKRAPDENNNVKRHRHHFYHIRIP